MRSIRLSLILCILLLLVLSLGAVSGLVYQTTERSLTANNASMREARAEKHEHDVARENANIDASLLADARHLAGVRFQIKRPDWRMFALSPLGLLPSSTAPQGYVNFPLWAYQGQWNWLNWRLTRMATKLQIRNIEALEEECQLAEYYQFNTIRGTQLRSKSLKDLDAHFAFAPKIFRDKRLDWVFDTTTIAKDLKVRRVRLKVSPAPIEFFSGRSSRGSSGRRPTRTTSFGMTVYVQAATDTASLEEAIAGHKEKFDRDLAALQENYENSLARLRNTLIIINLGTLAAALLVACVLVHFGLRPLSRLSEAVSRVSEKDFRLSVRTDHMPVELRPVAGRLRQTLEMLRRAFDREKQAAADISHELRTPLAALMTTLEVGLRKERSAEEYREMLTECQEAGRQMSSLVERLLALARLDAGSDRLRARDVDVGKLADQCAGLVRPLATARGLSLSVNAGGKAMIRTDPDKLREVLNNLLHNAIEYNKPNGEISVAVHRDNGSLHLEVRDTGIGIPEDARENIFERFYRQDSSRHIETESMHAGIGLALVKGYVDLMGGRIHVDSTVGEGSTFHLDLPANQSDD